MDDFIRLDHISIVSNMYTFVFYSYIIFEVRPHKADSYYEVAVARTH